MKLISPVFENVRTSGRAQFVFNMRNIAEIASHPTEPLSRATNP